MIDPTSASGSSSSSSSSSSRGSSSSGGSYTPKGTHYDATIKNNSQSQADQIQKYKDDYAAAAAKGDKAGIDALEKRLLAQNAEHKDWACTEEMMKLTKDGKALYLHCLPADITGLSCAEGEVDNSVFDRYIVPLYKQASYKPYIIAAMIFMAQVKDPVKALMELDEGKNNRKIF